MNRLLAAILLALAPFGALAQTVKDPAQIALVCAFNTSPPAPTSGQYYFVQCDNTGKLITTGSAATPGGSSGQLQYNNAGSFGGLSGTSWDDTNRSLTLTGATVTTSNPVLNLSQTWNAGGVTFTGLKFNATSTASAAGSLLLQLQAGAADKFTVDKSGTANIYGAFTDASNRDYLSLTKAAAGDVSILAQAAGTGTGGSIVFGVPVTAGAGVAATNVWKIGAGASAGALLAVTDNTYDIGASGANRPRNVYVAGTVMSGSNAATMNANGFLAAAGNYFYWNGRSAMKSTADGLITISNSAETDFGRLQFGGTTASFPALKRSTTSLQVRLADDSGYAPIAASAYSAGATAGVTCAGAPTGAFAVTNGIVTAC